MHSQKEKVIWRKDNIKVRYVKDGDTIRLVKELYLKNSRETRTLETFEMNKNIFESIKQI